ncbi:MAG: hypothetical protein ACTHJ6_04550 [Oryzihumus sp.]
MTEIVDVDPLDPLQDRVFRDWIEVHAAAERALWGDQATPWSAEEIRELQKAPERIRRAVAALDDDGRVVGAAQVIGATRDNLDSANLWLSVHPTTSVEAQAASSSRRARTSPVGSAAR